MKKQTPEKVIRRSPLKNRVIALLLTIAGFFCVGVGMKKYPDQVSVPAVIGVLLVLSGLFFRLKKAVVKS
jgi:hypothetical protein